MQDDKSELNNIINFKPKILPGGRGKTDAKIIAAQDQLIFYLSTILGNVVETRELNNRNRSTCLSSPVNSTRNILIKDTFHFLRYGCPTILWSGLYYLTRMKSRLSWVVS